MQTKCMHNNPDCTASVVLYVNISSSYAIVLSITRL